MLILGVNGIDGLFHDASATLIADGKIVATVEEERFNRRKHSNGIPFHAINYCLTRAGVKASDLDHIGYYLDPDVLEQTLVHDAVARYGGSREKLAYYSRAAADIRKMRESIHQQLTLSPRCNFQFLNHHLCHASSAFHVSGFDDAAILTIDGSGDRETSTLYHGRGNTLAKIADFLVYPESLGFIYTIMSDHVGFDWIAGPGKLMGLAGYGQADPSLFADVIRLHDDPQRPVSIDLSLFDYHTGGNGLSPKGRERFGPRRGEGEPMSPHYENIAASIQLALEEAILHLVRVSAKRLPGVGDLCFAGGVALNVCANRRIIDEGPFKRLFVPPLASDAGASLGCALHLSATKTGQAQHDFCVYAGTDITGDYNVEAALRSVGSRLRWRKLDEEAICRSAAERIAQNQIIGWAQGRMECGPRALGNRSILTNAGSHGAKDALNARVKKREPFRPYAPSVLRERCGEFFDLADSPHMLLEARVLPHQRDRVPGIVHVDGTARPQTVTRHDNPRYYRLLKEVERAADLPMVLNTSFNLHGEPIVNTPNEAIRDLLETEMDALYIGDYEITRNGDASQEKAA